MIYSTVNIDDVLQAACDCSGLSKETLLSPSRKQPAPLYRSFMYVILREREEYQLSLDEIGYLVGERNHATVHYALVRLEEELPLYQDTRDKLTKFIRRYEELRNERRG